jgi:hypothetical protein
MLWYASTADTSLTLTPQSGSVVSGTNGGSFTIQNVNPNLPISQTEVIITITSTDPNGVQSYGSPSNMYVGGYLPWCP